MIAVLRFKPGTAGLFLKERGKSELHRAVCQVMPGGRGSSRGYGSVPQKTYRLSKVRVKRCGKSAPPEQ